MNTGNCTYDVCAYLNCVHFFCICVVKLNIFSKNKNFNSLCYSILYVLDFRIFNWCSKICARDETMSFKPVMFICTYTYALKICYESRNSSTLNLIFSTLALLYPLYFPLRINNLDWYTKIFNQLDYYFITILKTFDEEIISITGRCTWLIFSVFLFDFHNN